MVSSAAVPTEEIDPQGGHELLVARSATTFRISAATLNCMSMEKSDAQDTTKEVCTNMAGGTHAGKLGAIEEWEILGRG